MKKPWRPKAMKSQRLDSEACDAWNRTLHLQSLQTQAKTEKKSSETEAKTTWNQEKTTTASGTATATLAIRISFSYPWTVRHGI